MAAPRNFQSPRLGGLGGERWGTRGGFVCRETCSWVGCCCLRGSTCSCSLSALKFKVRGQGGIAKGPPGVPVL